MLKIGYDIIPVRTVTRELEITIVPSKYPTPPLYTSNNIVFHCFTLLLSILMYIYILLPGHHFRSGAGILIRRGPIVWWGCGGRSYLSLSDGWRVTDGNGKWGE